jgi:hypothetical protein
MKLTSNLEAGLAGAGQGALNGGAINFGIGSLIGAVTGGFSSMFANAKGRDNTKRRYNLHLNRAVDQINFENQRLNDLNKTRQLSNMAAYGGILPINNNKYNNMNNFAIGGQLSGYGADVSRGINVFDAGGTHETNPMGGILQGFDEQGNPNFVEENEVK